jgi:hypothetical protein
MRVCRDDGAAGAAGVLSWDCAGGTDAPVAIKLGWRGPEAAAAPAPAVLVMLGAP